MRVEEFITQTKKVNHLLRWGINNIFTHHDIETTELEKHLSTELLNAEVNRKEIKTTFEKDLRILASNAVNFEFIRKDLIVLADSLYYFQDMGVRKEGNLNLRMDVLGFISLSAETVEWCIRLMNAYRFRSTDRTKSVLKFHADLVHFFDMLFRNCSPLFYAHKDDLNKIRKSMNSSYKSLQNQFGAVIPLINMAKDEWRAVFYNSGENAQTILKTELLQLRKSYDRFNDLTKRYELNNPTIYPKIKIWHQTKQRIANYLEYLETYQNNKETQQTEKNKELTFKQSPFVNEGDFQLFLYLNDRFNHKDKNRWTYIFHGLKDHKKCGISQADYFNYVSENFQEVAKRTQQTANDSALTQVIQSLYEQFESE